MQPTNPNQFTEKAWEALVRMPDITRQVQQQQMETEHLMKSLLEQDALTSSILNRAEINVQQWRTRTDDFIKRQPKISGSANGVYVGRSVDVLLDRAEVERKSFGDDFISIEHLLLAYASSCSETAQARLKDIKRPRQRPTGRSDGQT